MDKRIVKTITDAAIALSEDENLTDYQFCQKMKEELDKVEATVLQSENDGRRS